MSHDPLADFDREIIEFLESAGVPPGDVQLMTPPKREFGERATNAAMKLARDWKRAPQQIGAEIVAGFVPRAGSLIAGVEPAGGFINFRLNYQEFIPRVMAAVTEATAIFGRKEGRIGRDVIVEHTSVNPNKEWHVGHVRNAVLGDVVARIARLAGDNVQVQNYIDDTGLQAAQAIMGLVDFPEPPRPGEKFDHYCGRLYVKISAELGAEPDLRRRLDLLAPDLADNARERASLEARLDNIDRLKRRAMQVMHSLEDGEYAHLIRQILDAQRETATRLGIFYDLLNWESHLVQSHLFDKVVSVLENRPEVRRPTEGRYAGALVMETAPAAAPDEEPKCEVLIRKNGLPTYVGKDIAYHVWKFGLLPDPLRYVDFDKQANGEVLRSTALYGGEPRQFPDPDRVINIIGVHQSAAQDAVRSALRIAGFPEAADSLVHLAYGLVSTASGKLSGRRGTAVSGDAVIEEAVQAAYDRVREKQSQDLTADEMRAIAEAVGVGAVRYFMVQNNPLREIVFDVANVVSFDGNTALYIQYALVRMFAILRKAEEQGVGPVAPQDANLALLEHEQEKRLMFHIAQYPDTIDAAARTLAANLVAEYAFDLATIFNQFYRDCGVLHAEPELRAARLALVAVVRDALLNACDVLGLPIIERL